MDNLGDVALLVAVALGPVAVLVLMHPDRIARRGPSTFIGVRTSATMKSDVAWTRGHEVAWPLVRSGSVLALAVLLGGALVVSLLRPSLTEALPSALVIGALLLWMAFLLPAAVKAHRAAARTTGQR